MTDDGNTTTWRFGAFDTWFFRESRPMDSIGGSELASIFPPSATTLVGAIRTTIGEHAGVTDWSRYPTADAYAELRKQIGTNEQMGKLGIKGPWLACEHSDGVQRLYPAPLNLAAKFQKDKVVQVHRLGIGAPCTCDLGEQLRLPTTPKKLKGLKPLPGYWITGKTLTEILAGHTPRPETLINEKQLLHREPRLGIARDNRTRTVEEGLLYQTSHVRPAHGLSIEVDVTGVPASLHPGNGIIRLGGEGRGAHFQTGGAMAKGIEAGTIKGHPHGLILMLLTPLAVVDTANPMPLPGFERKETATGTCWCGHIGTIPLTIHCAILGRCLRQGGWDLAAGAPRPVRSLIPPGSLFYATLDSGDLDEARQTIAQARIGSDNDIALGRGQLIAGIWPQDELHTGTR